MKPPHLRPPRPSQIALAVLCAVALAACGSSAGLGTTQSSGGSMSAMTQTKSAAAGMSMGKSAMNPAGVPAHLLKVDGITPIPTQILTTSD